MKSSKRLKPFRPLDIGMLTVTDRHTIETDDVGRWLLDQIPAAGHRVSDRTVTGHDRYRIRAVVSAWIADPSTNAIIVNGGTGVMARNATPEAIFPLLDKPLDGFGELFRLLSHHDIGSSALSSRALAGVANATIIFAVPGSSGAVRLAWEALVRPQLDTRHRPCNLAELLPRMAEVDQHPAMTAMAEQT